MPGAQRDSRAAVLGAALAALLIATTFVGMRLALHDGDPTRWVRVGERVPDATALPPDFFRERGLGYDGQYYYRLARAPWSTDHLVDGLQFGRPVYRHQRIGYPIVAWALSAGGRQSLVPWTLAAANILAAAVAAGAAAVLLLRRGAARWHAVVMGLLPATVIALSFDLSEATEAALLLTSLAMIDRRRWPAAALLMCWAASTRETALLLPLALLATIVLRHVPLARRWRVAAENHVPIWVPLAPFVTYGLVNLALARAWSTGATGTGRTLEHAARPFVGFLDALGSLGERTPSDLGSFALLLAVGGAGLWVLATDRLAGAPHERLALLGATVLPVTLPQWERPVAFLRHTSLWVLFAVLIGMSCHRRLDRMQVRTVVAAAAIALSVVIALAIVGYPNDAVQLVAPVG
ncbi:MAG: hypothetical protein ACSLFP_01520 [Acidimicrobiales bacterium]